IAGTVTTTRYGATLGWIGMLLVHTGYRRQGIGTVLLRRAIDYLRSQGVRCIGLDATPAGQILYDAAGFETVWSLARWASSRPLQRPRQGVVETAIAAEVWPQAIAL